MLYAPCAHHSHIVLSASEDGWDAIVDRIAKQLYDGSLKPTDLDAATVKRIAKQLMKAVFEGSGTNFDDPNLSGDDFELLQQFEKNVYYFSSFKNYQQLKEANAALRDENGDLRSFADFKKEVLAINDKYNIQWLNAEYGNAHASAQMATKWQDIQNEKEMLPMLQYETVGDDRVREAHAAIDGVKRFVDDAFWKTYYPPNGWNCRCSVRQLDEEAQTPVKDIQYPEILPMFRMNVGTDKIIFPKKHPYIINTPRKDKPIVDANGQALIPYREFKQKPPFIENEIENVSDITQLITKYVGKHPEDFVRGFTEARLFNDPFGAMMSTTGSGIININTYFDRGSGLNPFGHLVSALNSIRMGKKLSFDEESAIQILWHEILHNKAKRPEFLNHYSYENGVMEICQEFTARHTYPQFMKRLGGKAANQKAIIANGYGYPPLIQNFRWMLQQLGIDESTMVEQTEKWILTKKYSDIAVLLDDWVQSKAKDSLLARDMVGELMIVPHEDYKQHFEGRLND